MLKSFIASGFKKPAKDPVNRFHHFNKTGQLIKAFESGGMQYYMFADEMRVPAKRAFAALDVYQELQFKTTREHLAAHYAAIKELANKGELGKIYVLTEEMEQRINYVTHIDILYKLAAVLYFDENENPEDFDMQYAMLKISKWQQDNDIAGFFLKTPIADYLPFSDFSNLNLNTFTQNQRKIELSQLQAILQNLPAETMHGELGPRILSQMETLKKLIH